LGATAALGGVGEGSGGSSAGEISSFPGVGDGFGERFPVAEGEDFALGDAEGVGETDGAGEMEGEITGVTDAAGDGDAVGVADGFEDFDLAFGEGDFRAPGDREGELFFTGLLAGETGFGETLAEVVFFFFAGLAVCP
jgi:hypothetical protein